jgi:hypothetical protein
MSNHLDPDTMTTEELEAQIAAENEAESSGNAGGEQLTPEGYQDPMPRPDAADPIMGAEPAQEPETPGQTDDEDRFPLNVRGETVYVTREEMTNLAQQGKDYNLKSHEVNQRKAELDRLQEELSRREAALSGGYAPPAYPAPPYPYQDPDQLRTRSQELFAEDPIGAAHAVANSSMAPLRAELAEMKAAQDPLWSEAEPVFRDFRRQGMGVDEAFTRAKLTVLERERDERKRTEATEADKKRARARAATYPTGTPGAAAVPNKPPLTRKDVDAMSTKDLEKSIEELGGHIDRELT